VYKKIPAVKAVESPEVYTKARYDTDEKNTQFGNPYFKVCSQVDFDVSQRNYSKQKTYPSKEKEYEAVKPQC
jgi:hypothetical protein